MPCRRNKNVTNRLARFFGGHGLGRESEAEALPGYERRGGPAPLGGGWCCRIGFLEYISKVGTQADSNPPSQPFVDFPEFQTFLHCFLLSDSTVLARACLWAGRGRRPLCASKHLLHQHRLSTNQIVFFHQRGQISSIEPNDILGGKRPKIVRLLIV